MINFNQLTLSGEKFLIQSGLRQKYDEMLANLDLFVQFQLSDPLLAITFLDNAYNLQKQLQKQIKQKQGNYLFPNLFNDILESIKVPVPTSTLCPFCGIYYIESHFCEVFSRESLTTLCGSGSQDTLCLEFDYDLLLDEYVTTQDVNLLEQYFDYKMNDWVRDLTTEGIEPNPGPNRVPDNVDFHIVGSTHEGTLVKFTFLEDDLCLFVILRISDPSVLSLNGVIALFQYLMYQIEHFNPRILRHRSGELGFVDYVPPYEDLEDVVRALSDRDMTPIEDYNDTFPNQNFRDFNEVVNYVCDSQIQEYEECEQFVDLISEKIEYKIKLIEDLTKEGIEPNPGPFQVPEAALENIVTAGIVMFLGLKNFLYVLVCAFIVGFLSGIFHISPVQVFRCAAIVRYVIFTIACLSWLRDLTMEGIEPNPGPVYFYVLSYLYFLILMYLVSTVRSRIQLDTLILVTLNFVYFTFTWPLPFYQIPFPKDLTTEGIEPNPGPVYNRSRTNELILKRIHQLQREVSMRPESDPSGTRVTTLLEKIAKLKKESNKFFPESAIDVSGKFAAEGLEFGLDDRSRKFLANLVSQLGDIFGTGTTVSVDFGFTKAFKEIFTGAALLGDFFVDLLKFILCFLCENVRDTFKPLFQFLKSFIPKFQAEGGLADAASFFYFKDTLGKHIAERDFIRFVGSFKSFRDTSKNTESIFEYVLSFLHAIFDFLSVYFDIEMPKFLKSGNSDLDALYERFRLLRVEYRSGVASEYSFAEKVFWLQNDIEGLLGKYKDPQVKERINYLLQSFKPLIDYCERNTNTTNGPRIEPGSILIGGPTGVGKSTFTMPMILAILARLLPKELHKDFLKNHNDFLFFRANENEFWDGLKLRNKVIVYDDFGQRRDTAGNPNLDAFEVIRLINTAPYHLHFSSINEKQKNFANPMAVFATTNRAKIHFDSVVCSEAIIRRFKFAYIQVPKIEFCKEGYDPLNPMSRRLDEEKMRQKYPLDFDDPATFACEDVIEFIPWDFANGYATGESPLSFNDVISKFVAKTRELAKRGDLMLSHHKSIKERFLAESGINTDDEEDIFYDSESSFYGKVDLSSIRGAMDVTMTSLYDAFLDMIGYSCRPSFSLPSKNTFIKLSMFVSLIGSAVVGYYTLRNFFEVDAESTHGKNKKDVAKKVRKNHKKVNRKNISSRMNEMSLRAESSSLQACDWLISLLKRNTYAIELNKQHIGYVIFLKGTTFICPAHFDFNIVRTINETDDENYTPIVNFRSVWNNSVSFAIKWLDITFALFSKEKNGMDLMVAQLDPLTCRLHSDITKHFAKSSVFSAGNKYNCVMPVSRDDRVIFLAPLVQIAGDINYKVFDEEGDEVELRTEKLVYMAPSKGGDCGSPIVTTDGRFGIPTLLGIHTAGSVSQNFFGFGTDKTCGGVLLTREIIDQCLTIFDEQEFQEEIRVDDKVFTAQGFAALREDIQPRRAENTSIVPSPFHGKLWEVTKKPAWLRPFTNSSGEVINPRIKAMQKYLHDEPYCDKDILDTISPHVAKMILKVVKPAPWKSRVFSFEEATAGINGVEYCDGVVRSTSPGYPFVLNNKLGGKKYWFGSEGEVDFTSIGTQEAKELVMTIVNKAKRGIRSENIFIDHMKDELRPIAKVDEGKTRQFMACSFPYLIAVKMYFGDFVRHVCDNRVINGVAVGINPYDEWDLLADHLQRDGSFVFTAGDYSAYDGKIPVPIGLRVLEIIESFYTNATDEDRYVRKILFQEIINSIHIADGVVYEFVGGNPSGNPITTIYNSICNILLLYGCAEKIRRDKEMEITTSDLFLHSVVQTFGDDNIIAYRKILGSCFEQQELTRYMKSMFNLDYTNEAKDSNVVTERKLTEVTFLKRGFRYDQGWMCPLELRVILETLNWQKKNINVREMEERIEAVLRELSLHGKQVFQTYSPKIIQLAEEIYGYHSVGSTYMMAKASAFGLAV